MKTVAIIQARLGSSRLPGKVLMDLGGDTVLARVVRRVQRARLVNEVIVATTEASRDDRLVNECDRLGVQSIRGSEDDVLDRYHKAAQVSAADVVVRVTSDCPLIDPELVDDTIQVFTTESADYASNVFPRRYPRGLDVEVFSAGALQRAWREAREPHQREHVTPYFFENPQLFRMSSIACEADYSQHRWTLDTPEDLKFLRAIYEAFSDAEQCGWKRILAFVELHPELTALNAHVVQKFVPAQASKS